MMQIAEDICEVGRRMYARELVSSNDGNISVRIDSDKMLITPTLTCKGFMRPSDMVLMDFDGNVIKGKNKPSSEYMLHAAVYMAGGGINAVVHAHPVTVCAFAVVGRSVDMKYMPEAAVTLGDFPLAEYAKPGTLGLAKSVEPFIEDYNGCLLANHGAVSWSKDLFAAYYLMEQLEFYCKTSIIAEHIGKPNIIQNF